jgi:signal transduction histidine kinase
VLRNYSIKLPYLEQDYGFNIESVGTGEEALERLRKGGYDLMLLDNQLPGIYGTEVLEIVKKEKIDVLTIMITAFASLETAVAATKNGAYDFITKPFLPEDLKSSIQKAAKHLIFTETTRKLIEEKKRVRFEFIRVLSHELKSPIAAVEGYLNIMKKRMKGEALSEYDYMIDRSVLRINGMRKLVMDMLDLTHIESEEKKRELSALNLNEVIKTAIQSVKEAGINNGVTIDFQEKDAIVIEADRFEMDMIVKNLVSNAVKYNKENGEVCLVLTKDENSVEIECRDSGIGMTEEELERLFGEFVRMKNEETKNIVGSGLGLSIVKKIVDLYNGEIGVESERGKGSTFKVTLPTH